MAMGNAFERIRRGATVSAIGIALLTLSACSGGASSDPDRPVAPSDVTATPGPGYVEVAWQHDGRDVTGFEVTRQRTEATGAVVSQQVDRFEVPPEARSYVDASVEPGVGYAYSVAALGAGGASDAATPPAGAASVAVDVGVDLVVGTRNHWAETTTGTLFLIYYVLPEEVLADPSVTVRSTLTGPAGWNDDDAIVLEHDADARARQDGYLLHGTGAAALPGDFELSVEVLGGAESASYGATATLADAATELGLPAGVAVTDVTAERVTVTWTGPAGAESTGVALYTDGYAEVVADYRFTTGGTVDFDGLALADGRYVAQVAAFDVDLTEYPVKPEALRNAFTRAVFDFGSLTVAAGATSSESALIAAAVERYRETNPGVTIELLDQDALGGDRLTAYQDAFDTMSPDIDVVQIDIAWVGLVAEHLVDLYDHGAGAVVSDHFASQIANNTVDGALVAIPWFGDAGLLYYRTDLVDAYGFDGPPTTWDELEAMAAVIQDGERTAGDAGFWGYVWQGNAYEGLTVNALEWIASSGGGTIISSDGVVTIDNPAAVDAVTQAAGWVGAISPDEVTTYAEENARNLFQAGNAAFMRNWPYAYALGQAEGSPIADSFDVAPLPAGPGGTSAGVLGGWQLGVSLYSDVPALAAEVALFLASEEEQKTRAIEGAYNPTIAALYEDPEVLDANPFFASLRDVFDGATARPTTVTGPVYPDVSNSFSSAVHDVLTGTLAASEALEQVSLDLQAITGFPAGQP